MQPVLLHQHFVVGAQVDRRDYATFAVENSAGTGQKNDFERLNRANQFVGRNIRIDVQYLPVRGLAEWRYDRDDVRA